MTVQNVFMVVMTALPQVIGPISLDVAEVYKDSFSLSDLFFHMGLIAGVLGVGLFSLSGWFVKERIEQSKETPGFKESLSQFVKNLVLRIVILSNLIFSFWSVGTFFQTITLLMLWDLQA